MRQLRRLRRALRTYLTSTLTWSAAWRFAGNERNRLAVHRKPKKSPFYLRRRQDGNVYVEPVPQR